MIGLWRKHESDVLETESFLFMFVERSKISCILMLISCFRFGNLSSITLLKSLFFFPFDFISIFFYSVDSQVWSFGCIPDFLDILVTFSIVFLYICLSVSFSQFCSA